jgi:hypothetical protein
VFLLSGCDLVLRAFSSGVRGFRKGNHRSWRLYLVNKFSSVFWYPTNWGSCGWVRKIRGGARRREREK